MSAGIKPGVRVQGVRSELAFALPFIIDAYKSFGLELTVTAVIDGSHSRASLHYAGAAMDLRTRNVPTDKIEPLRKTMADSLGPDFDVLFETDHYHVEYQPKTPYGA